MAELMGLEAIAAARDAAEAAIDEHDDAAVALARVGCAWDDARAMARRAAAAMAALLAASPGGGAERPDALALEQIEETWLSGLVVGLFLDGPAGRVTVDANALAAAMADLSADGRQLATRLSGLGVDPEAAQEAAGSVGLTARRRGARADGTPDLDWSAALASAWLDGLMVARSARATSEGGA